MKKSCVLKTLFSIFSAIVIIGCNHDVDPEISGLEGLRISLSVDELSQEEADLRIRHNGDAGLLWYYFLTEDFDTDATTLFTRELEKTLDFQDDQLIAFKGQNRSVTVSNLASSTEYRVVAAILSGSGKVVSNVADLVFRTMRNPEDFWVNDNWNISYNGRSYDNTEAGVECFKCETSDTLSFVPVVLTKSDFENTYGGNIRECFESYVEYRNSENVKWNRVVSAQDTIRVQDRLRHGEYVAFMMGIDSLGVLSGYYAKKEITIDQEEHLDTYAAWLGEWTVSGQCDGQEIVYNIRIEEDEANLYYNMYGWESTTAKYYQYVTETYPITMYFERSTGKAYVISSFIARLGADDEGMVPMVYLYGNMDSEEGVTPINIENKRLACFHFDGSTPRISAEEYSAYDSYGNHYTGFYKSFSFSYTLTGYEWVGFAPLTEGSKVPNLAGIKIQRP